jgi:glycosyltransferase involved in cell wall biosynthesis
LFIVYDYQAFHQKYGGISRYFFELAKYAGSVDQNIVEVQAFFHSNEYLKDANKFRIIGVKLPASDFLGRLTSRLNAVGSRLVTPIKKGVDIYHETYYLHGDYAPPSAKRVITVFDMIAERFDSDSRSEMQLRRIKSRAINRADHIICISKNTQRDLVEILNVPIQKTSVVYLGHSNLQNHRPSDLNFSKPYILYVGQRDGYKNFTGLLRAFSNSRILKNDYLLICFGGGSFTLKEKKLIKYMGINSERICYLTGDDSLLCNLYEGASVFVYPSMYEGFGIPLLEAMSLNCPVACSNSSSFPEVVGDAASMFDPIDVHQIQGAIEKIITVPEYASNLIQNGRNRLSIFSWENCGKNTLYIYRNLL